MASLVLTVNIQIINHDASQIHIVVSSRGSMDDDWASNAITVLGVEMAVVPAGTVGCCLPLIDPGVTWCKCALSHTWNTIVRVRANLADTVPMDGGTVALHLVVNRDLDRVTPVALDGRSWNLAVDGKSKSWGSVIAHRGVGDGEVEFADFASVGPGGMRISVDVESVAPLSSVGGRVAVIVGDWLGRGFAAGVGRASGPSGGHRL